MAKCNFLCHIGIARRHLHPRFRERKLLTNSKIKNRFSSILFHCRIQSTPSTSLGIIVCDAEVEMNLLKVTKFESVWSNFDLLTSNYFYIYIIIFRRTLKVARMLTNVKGLRLVPDHEKVMTADGKCTEGLNIFMFSNWNALSIVYDFPQ